VCCGCLLLLFSHGLLLSLFGFKFHLCRPQYASKFHFFLHTARCGILPGFRACVCSPVDTDDALPLNRAVCKALSAPRIKKLFFTNRSWATWHERVKCRSKRRSRCPRNASFRIRDRSKLMEQCKRNRIDVKEGGKTDPEKDIDATRWRSLTYDILAGACLAALETQGEPGLENDRCPANGVDLVSLPRSHEEVDDDAQEDEIFWFLVYFFITFSLHSLSPGTKFLRKKLTKSAARWQSGRCSESTGLGILARLQIKLDPRNGCCLWMGCCSVSVPHFQCLSISPSSDEIFVHTRSGSQQHATQHDDEIDPSSWPSAQEKHPAAVAAPMTPQHVQSHKAQRQVLETILASGDRPEADSSYNWQAPPTSNQQQQERPPSVGYGVHAGDDVRARSPGG